MYETLNSRMKSYEKLYDTEIMRKIPIVVRVDGIGFSRLCQNIKKPYNALFLEAMTQTMLKVISNIDGAVFGYQQSDEITFIIKNDNIVDEVWYNNRIQKIGTSISSYVTYYFNNFIEPLREELNLVGEAVFSGIVFGLPNISETINGLIDRQHYCIINSISSTSQFLLGKKYGKKEALSMLQNLSIQEKLELMNEECGIDFEQEYPSSFRLGTAAYKYPVIFLNKKEEEIIRNKWKIDWEIKKFSEHKDFIYNLILNGHDVFRAADLKE